MMRNERAYKVGNFQSWEMEYEKKIKEFYKGKKINFKREMDFIEKYIGNSKAILTEKFASYELMDYTVLCSCFNSGALELAYDFKDLNDEYVIDQHFKFMDKKLTHRENLRALRYLLFAKSEVTKEKYKKEVRREFGPRF